MAPVTPMEIESRYRQMKKLGHYSSTRPIKWGWLLYASDGWMDTFRQVDREIKDRIQGDRAVQTEANWVSNDQSDDEEMVDSPVLTMEDQEQKEVDQESMLLDDQENEEQDKVVEESKAVEQDKIVGQEDNQESKGEQDKNEKVRTFADMFDVDSEESGPNEVTGKLLDFVQRDLDF